MRKLFILPVLIAAVVALGGWGSIGITPINEVIESPANFDGKEVVLRGVAKDITRIPLVNLRSYVLKDDSGEITILTEADLPKMNEEISVKARVENIAIIKGKSVGMTVTEVERR